MIYVLTNKFKPELNEVHLYGFSDWKLVNSVDEIVDEEATVVACYGADVSGLKNEVLRSVINWIDSPDDPDPLATIIFEGIKWTVLSLLDNDNNIVTQEVMPLIIGSEEECYILASVGALIHKRKLGDFSENISRNLDIVEPVSSINLERLFRYAKYKRLPLTVNGKWVKLFKNKKGGLEVIVVQPENFNEIKDTKAPLIKKITGDTYIECLPDKDGNRKFALVTAIEGKDIPFNAVSNDPMWQLMNALRKRS